MKKLSIPVFVVSVLIPTLALAQRSSPGGVGHAQVAMLLDTLANLPFAPIGVADLVHLTVRDSPELSQSFRVDDQGRLNLPLLKAPLVAKGLTPTALGDEITAALREQHLLVNPIVVVSMVEYRSRTLIVDGAVKTPTTIEDSGDLSPLGALSKAGGLLPQAGPVVLVEEVNHLTLRVSARELYDGLRPQLNMPVTAGIEIRVPQCEQVYVVGNVRVPGAFRYQKTTVLKVLEVAGGLRPYSFKTAYIYRNKAGSPSKQVVEVPLKSIMKKKSPDVSLSPGDILYFPINRKTQLSPATLNKIAPPEMELGAEPCLQP